MTANPNLASQKTLGKKAASIDDNAPVCHYDEDCINNVDTPAVTTYYVDTLSNRSKPYESRFEEMG